MQRVTSGMDEAALLAPATSAEPSHPDVTLKDIVCADRMLLGTSVICVLLNERSWIPTVVDVSI